MQAQGRIPINEIKTTASDANSKAVKKLEDIMKGRDILTKLTLTSNPITHLKIVVNAKDIKYYENNVQFKFGFFKDKEIVVIRYMPLLRNFSMSFYNGEISPFKCRKTLTSIDEDILKSTFEDETFMMI